MQSNKWFPIVLCTALGLLIVVVFACSISITLCFLLVATKENSITWKLLFNWQLYKADLSSQGLRRKRRTLCASAYLSVSSACIDVLTCRYREKGEKMKTTVFEEGVRLFTSEKRQ